jgi:hypothetical protein
VTLVGIHRKCLIVPLGLGFVLTERREEAGCACFVLHNDYMFRHVIKPSSRSQTLQ